MNQSSTPLPGRTIRLQEKEYLFFSGYAYLGMSALPAFRELVKEGIDRYGLSFPSSRISNTRLDLFEELEQRLSQLTGKAETVCFASGFAAATALSRQWPQLFAAPGTHPALCKGQPYPGNFANWATAAQQPAKENVTVLASDSVNIFAPSVHDFSFLQNIPQPLHLLLDDSHGIGLIGTNGEGISGRLPDTLHTVCLTYSLSKAFNLVGGAVSCDRHTAQKLRATPEYTASTALPPAYAYAWLQADTLYRQQRLQLQRNCALLHSLLSPLPSIRTCRELPVFVLQQPVEEALLQQQGFLLSSFAYPNPKGKKQQRIVLNALHTADDLHRLAAALRQQLAS